MMGVGGCCLHRLSGGIGRLAKPSSLLEGNLQCTPPPAHALTGWPVG